MAYESLNDSEAFVALARERSFTRAAAQLDAVSHLVFIESSLPDFGQEEAMDVSEGGSWHFGFNMAGDISEALVRGREHLFVDHFMRREMVGVFDPDSVTEADIAHYARALARPSALRCSFGYYRTLPIDRRDNAVWGNVRSPCRSSPSARPGDTGRNRHGRSAGWRATSETF